MITPPDVVLSFSYIRGCFVYCPFLLDLFTAYRLFLCFYRVSEVPHPIEYCAQQQYGAARIQPQHQNHDGGQGAVKQGIPGRQADEPGEHRRGQNHGR